jgi:hypothetical protein
MSKQSPPHSNSAPKFGEFAAMRSRSRSPKRRQSPLEEIEVELTSVRPTGLSIAGDVDEGALGLLPASKSSSALGADHSNSSSIAAKSSSKRNSGSRYAPLGHDEDGTDDEHVTIELGGVRSSAQHSSATQRSEDGRSGGDEGDLQWVLEHEGAGGRATAPCACISGRHLVYLCAVCSSLCNVLLGYDVGVMSGAKVSSSYLYSYYHSCC